MSVMQTPRSSSPPVSQNTMADMLCTIMILCRGTGEDGMPCWAYMCIKPSMAQSFKEARDRGMFDIEEFGTVIESGLGIEPPESVKRRMEHDYGMNHGFEDDLLKLLRKMKNQDRF